MTRYLITLFLSLIFSQAYAAAGCCSHHGGVKGCNTATNYELCKDGTTSPTCLCSGKTTAAPTKQKNVTKTTTTTTTTTGTTAATTTATTAKKATKGCCARHGGVAGCDSATGYSKCKDGTVSSTCKCS